MVTIKSLASVLVLYINIKYTLARNVPTFKTKYHEVLKQHAGLYLDSQNIHQVSSLCLALIGRRYTPHGSRERIQMFSYSVLALMVIKFYTPR